MWCLGVDGGNSKTVAVVIDGDGRVQGLGQAGGSNYQTAGLRSASRELQRATEMALAEAGIAKEELASAVFALAGADRPVDVERIEGMLAQLGTPHWSLVCDTHAGLRLGGPAQVGVVLICGAGTNAFGRSPAGAAVQTGGFGWLFGDGAGGDHLARLAFRAAIRAWEHRDPPTLLMTQVPAHLGFADVPAMVEHFLKQPWPQIPLELAEVVHDAARAGDATACALLEELGRELGLAAHSVLVRLGWPAAQEASIVLIGSILQKGRDPRVLSQLSRVLEERGWRHRLVIPEAPPVWGAALLALDSAGVRLAREREVHLGRALWARLSSSA